MPDAAIDELSEPDRIAVVLRFLKQSSFSRIGAALRVTEDATRMRTDRALEKLRAALARRGITSTAAALSTLVTSQPVISAPLGLTGTLVAQSLATAPAGVGVGLLATFTALMNAKLITTAAVTALIFFAAGAYFGFDATAQLPLPPLAITSNQPQKIAALRRENERLQTEVVQLNAKVVAPNNPSPSPQPTTSTVQPPPTDPGVAVRQRAMLNNLRQLSGATAQFKLETGRYPTSIDELVGETKYIKVLNSVDGENYAGLPLTGQPMTVFSATGISVTYDARGSTTTMVAPRSLADQMANMGSDWGPKVGPSLQRAVAAYQATHGGSVPPNPQALIPYFATTAESADFVERMEAMMAAKNLPR